MFVFSFSSVAKGNTKSRKQEIRRIQHRNKKVGA